MPHEHNRFAEVRKKASAKRAELDAKTSQRKAKEARELTKALAERAENEAPSKGRKGSEVS